MEIGWWGPNVEFGKIRPGENHGESRAHIPLAMRRVMNGCREIGRYRQNFPAQSLHSPSPLIWSGPRHDQTIEEWTRLMDVHDRLGSETPNGDMGH
jgi:hypothetical protein